MTNYRSIHTVDGEEISVTRIGNDMNGNPRYVVHFLDIGVKPADYGFIPGLKKYRAKWFGGGYVFQSYDIHSDLKHALNLVKEFYEKQK